MSCRICQEPTENDAPHCEYHTLLNGGLTIATTINPDEDNSLSPKHTEHAAKGGLVDELISGLGTRREKSYRDSSSRGSRSSANSSYAEKVDNTALLLADPTLDRVLIVPMALHYFARFLISESSEENIEFWEAARRWNYSYDMGTLPPDTLVHEAQDIIDNFIGESAPKQINLSAVMVAQVRAAEKFTDPDLKIEALRDAFSVCKNAVLKIMGDDGFRRFLKSALWQEYSTNSQEVRKGATQTVHMPNGDLYVGELRDERPHGHGVTTFHTGDRHTGKYKDGMMHGIGEFVTKTTRFVGEFYENFKHGEGVLYETDTDRNVQGSWVRDQLHGQGVSNEGSSVFDMVWKDGKVVCRLQREDVRLLGNLTAEHLVGSRRVHCTIGISGLSYGFMKGSTGHEKGMLQWTYLDHPSINLSQSSLQLNFLKHGEVTTVVVQPCDPLAATMRLIESVNFAAQVSTRNPPLLLAQAKVLFARIAEKLKRRDEFAERVQEVMNSITENEMALKCSQDGVEGLEDQERGGKCGLAALQQETQSLLVEQRQLEGYLDTDLLVADCKLLKVIHGRLWEEKKVELERVPSRGRLSLSRLSFGRKVSTCRSSSPSPTHKDATPSDDLHQIDELINKTNMMLESHKLAKV